MTEDMHEERLRAVQAFGSAFVSLLSHVNLTASFTPHDSHFFLITELFGAIGERYIIFR